METAIVVIAAVVILAALSMEMKLSRANRIARASHDLLKEMLELQKASAAGKEENAERSEPDRRIPNAESRMREPDAQKRVPAASDVYRI